MIVRDLSFAADGTLLTPNVHDGNLLGLFTLASEEAVLLIRIQDREEIIGLCLEGVERLRADDFREGNVILDLAFTTGPAVRPEQVRYAYGVSAGVETFLSGVMQQFASGDLCLLTLSASYGCTIVCVCKGLRLCRDWKETLDKRL